MIHRQRCLGRCSCRVLLLVTFVLVVASIVTLIKSKVLQQSDVLSTIQSIVRWRGWQTLDTDIEFNNDLLSHTIDGLEDLSSILTKIHRQHHYSNSEQQMMKAYRQVVHLLDLLGEKPAHIIPNKLPAVENKDVCQEYFPGKALSSGYPFFYHGFEIQNCTGTPKFHTLLTMVYNFVHYQPSDLPRIKKIIQNVNSVYPGIQIVVGVPKGEWSDKMFKDTRMFSFDYSAADTDIWNTLISHVNTKYIYIGRGVAHFTWFDRLERLVREINNLNVSFVGSASRTFISGKWSNGCEQSILQNYTLVYRQGYDRSMEECMVCDYTRASFVTKTELFKQFPLMKSITEQSGFVVWFLMLKQKSHMGVVCPDSMSFVTDESRKTNTKENWVHAASILQVEQLITADNTVLEFSCHEAGTSCIKVRNSGAALSKCCMERLSSLIKYIMKNCKDAGILCELQGGTLVGAVKFNGILPWEAGGEIVVDKKQIEEFEVKLKNNFINNGYKWETSAHNDGYSVSDDDWTVRIFSSDKLSTSAVKSKGITPTLVNLDGEYLATAENPAGAIRDRYGNDIYQHGLYSTSENPWDQVFQPSKGFPVCYLSDHHSCLNQYLNDGNLLFRKPVQ